MKRLLVAFLAVCLTVSSFSLSAFAAEKNSTLEAKAAASKDSSFDETKQTTPVEYVKYDSYQTYASKHENEPSGTEEIVIDASKLTKSTSDVKIKKDYDGRKGNSIFTDEKSDIEFTFNAKAGLYFMLIEYHTEEGKDVSIERALYLNGEIPFDSAEDMNLTRVWVDDVDHDKDGNPNFVKDKFGNGMVPDQKENFCWTNSYFVDNQGFYTDPLQFSIKEGKNTLRLKSVKEPMTIGAIKLVPVVKTVSYEEYINECNSKGYANYADEEIKIQAEAAVEKSDQTLYPVSDVASASTSMYNDKQDAYLQKVNMIGGTNWQYTQQRITWKVPESAKPGLYRISFKARKNVYEGMISSRKLYVKHKDDEFAKVPYQEASAISFKYSDDWELVSPVTSDGKECLTYIEPGDEISLETSLGEMGDILREAEDLLNDINENYRSIIMITGSSPDTTRDYKLDKLIPEVIENIGKQAKRIDSIVTRVVKFTQNKGSEMSTLETLSRQMKEFVDDAAEIPKQLSTYKTNIGSFGTWINDANYTPLELDYISLSSPDKEPDEAQVGFFTSFGYSFNRFISSFVVDYNAIGTMDLEVKKDEQPITVWINSGRDQYQQLRALINNNYTQQTQHQVNLKLVSQAAVLGAVVAGIGPDVLLNQAQGEPVNYALRNAVEPLDDYDGFDEVVQRFSPEAMIPYKLNNGKKTKTYALPETQTFTMLFYRKDVLAQLGLGIPNTWDQVIQVMTTLNKNNMEFGLPQSLGMFYSMLKQYGGQMYTSDGKSTDLKTTAATKAFKLWTNFFVNYGSPLSYDFKNRFRTGEMPLGIEAYTLYNTLAVSAPEIRGLWGFTSLPGIVQADGTIDRTCDLGTSCCIMLKDNSNKELSWEFMKWWTNAETQKLYGKRMECVLGLSARYNPANQEAFSHLPWSDTEISAINTQLESAAALPEIPGSYFLTRHISNAFRKVVYNSKDARDTLFDYSNVIDSEITKKRSEFNLPVNETK